MKINHLSTPKCKDTPKFFKIFSKSLKTVNQVNQVSESNNQRKNGGGNRISSMSGFLFNTVKDCINTLQTFGGQNVSIT